MKKKNLKKKFRLKHLKNKVRFFDIALEKAVAALTTVSKATNISGSVFVLSNFLLNLVFSYSLNSLWTLVNAL